MESTIRVLGIAPYEGMKTLMASLAGEYPQMDLELFVGDLEEGLEIAQRNFHGNYDVVISRGGTARMLQQHLSLPVVEIEISEYDILCALKLAGGIPGKAAIVSFAETSSNARQLCSLLGYNVDIYTLPSRDQVESTLQQLKCNDYQVILCDMIANTIAKRLGMNSILISSGIDSIRQAFQRALQLCQSRETIQNENLFLRQLLSGQIGHTVVFTENGSLFLSTFENISASLIHLLQQEVPETLQAGEHRIIRMLSGTLYTIRGKRITSGALVYIAFFFTARKVSLPANRAGIRFFSLPEVENIFCDSIFSFAGIIADYQDCIAQINRSRAPVIVTGEAGSEEESIIHALYMQSPLKNNTFVCVDCRQLNEKTWTFLLEHPNSPLSDEGNTLYFPCVDALSPERCQYLLDALADMDVCRRNRVIFSFRCQAEERMPAAAALFADKFYCLSIHLEPLRKNSDRIPMLVNLSLSHLNANVPCQITGVEPSAMTLLQEFPWPHNFAQLRRVVSELAMMSSTPIITTEHVHCQLSKELEKNTSTVTDRDTSKALNLNRTLDEINRDIAYRVVEDTQGNQTAAAKRLGISRTTLWRLLKNNAGSEM